MKEINLVEILTSAVLIAFAAYVFNYLHWLQVEKKKKTSLKGKILIQTIDKLKDISIDYWSMDHSSQNADQIRKKKIDEINIRSLCLLVSSLNDEFLTVLPSKTDSDKLIRVREFPSRLFDLSSGGEFETTNKKADFQRCSKLSVECHKVISIIGSLIY